VFFLTFFQNFIVFNTNCAPIKKRLRTTGVNFTNILRAAFTSAEPKNAKRYWFLYCPFALLGSVHVKTSHEHACPEVNFINVFEQLLCMPIPKAQKIQSRCQHFFKVGIYSCKNFAWTYWWDWPLVLTFKLNSLCDTFLF